MKRNIQDKMLHDRNNWVIMDQMIHRTRRPSDFPYSIATGCLQDVADRSIEKSQRVKKLNFEHVTHVLSAERVSRAILKNGFAMCAIE